MLRRKVAFFDGKTPQNRVFLLVFGIFLSGNQWFLHQKAACFVSS